MQDVRNPNSKRETVISSGGLHTGFQEEIRYFEQNRVYSIQIESTLACPQSCLYCYASGENACLKEMPGSDVRLIIDSAVKMGVRTIDWLGGDPLVRGDWYELMKYAADSRLTNNIWSSGIPLEDMDIARKAVEVTANGFISVHLDTLDETLYRQLHNGDARKKIQSILRGVENVRSLGKDPGQMINCITFTRPLASDVERTIQYFYAEKGVRTCLTQMCAAGLARHHLEWAPDAVETEAACKVRDVVNYPSSSVSFCTMDTNKYYCGGTICVTVDGDVTPCSVIRKSFGNIHGVPLEKIVKNEKESLLMIPLRDISNVSGQCSGCKNNSVCWGCRATAYYETGDLFGRDPKCYVRRQ
ncbi:MAG: radical SAM protein [Dehalococcoidia bacterium]